MTHKPAFLVIDVQQGLFERSAPIYQADDVLKKINLLAAAAHEKKIPVIYIQHENDTFLKKGTREWQFHDQIRPQEDDFLIAKLFRNAFEQTKLHQLLQDQQIDTIIASGLVTHGCVQATCLGGLELGYKVILAKDAHSNSSQTAVQIIEKWHTKLADAGVELLETSEINF